METGQRLLVGFSLADAIAVALGAKGRVHVRLLDHNPSPLKHVRRGLAL